MTVVAKLGRSLGSIALVCTIVAGLPAGAVAAAPATVEPAGAVGPHGKKLYYFMVFSNAKPGQDEEFARWYDRIHAPVMIEEGDFISARRFAVSPLELGSGGVPKRQYVVIFTIETDDIARVAADMKKRLKMPRNVKGTAIDYDSLMSLTLEAVGPVITRKDARRSLAEEEAAGNVPPAGASAAKGQ